MGQSLKEIAQSLKDANKKVQLIYAFNGIGKTRLSREFKELIASKEAEAGEQEESVIKMLYYNAFTEDLFYWDNDLDADINRKLIIRPNGFTNLALQFLKDQGQDANIVSHFQHYTNLSITPKFSEDFSEVVFSMQTGGNDSIENIKISRGEESNFIWCVFYSLLEQIVEVLNSVGEAKEKAKTAEKIAKEKAEEARKKAKTAEKTAKKKAKSAATEMAKKAAEAANVEAQAAKVEAEAAKAESESFDNRFDNLEYVFIDDPVSSLDDNHLIELAVNVAELIKSSHSNLKFIITTHNPLFYNVLFNEIGNRACYMLTKFEDGTYEFSLKQGDSNKSFSYHLYLKHLIEEAIASNSIQKYHFMLLRNLYEKTANFLGYPQWSMLLPDDKQTYYNRVIQFTSHSTLSNEVVPEPTEPEKQIIKFLLEHLVNNNYWKEEQNGTV